MASSQPIDDNISQDQPRKRVLTEKGQEQFDSSYSKYYTKYETARVALLQHITYIKDVTESQQLNTYEHDLKAIYSKFTEVANELCQFLERYNTVECETRHVVLTSEINDTGMQVDFCVDSIKRLRREIADRDTSKSVQHDALSETGSKHSHHSRAKSHRSGTNKSHRSGTNKSSASHVSKNSLLSITIQKRAKAEAAVAKLAYSAKEVDLQKKQAVLTEQELFNSAKVAKERAIIDAELRLLRDKKEVAAALAEADALDNCIDRDLDQGSLTSQSLYSLGAIDSKERVKHYVNNHGGSYISATHTDKQFQVTSSREMGDPEHMSRHIQRNLSFHTDTLSHASPSMGDASSDFADHIPQYRSTTNTGTHNSPVPQCSDNVSDTRRDLQHNVQSKSEAPSLNPDAKVFIPSDNVNVTAAAEIGQFLIRKELLISRLTEFNEKPETYEAWKTSFKRLVTELKLTPSDELEMLSKWLGPTSRKYAESSRNSNMADPARGVKLLWERLDRCYGTPEEIEASLIRRLNSFDPITYGTPKRYYDLLDLLAEIESLQTK